VEFTGGLEVKVDAMTGTVLTTENGSDRLVYPGAGILNIDNDREHRPIIRTRKGSGNPFPAPATGDLAAQTG
jgi:hypothetical protein